MKQTFNFHIPDQLRERLRAENRRAGVSEAEIVRAALDQYLERREQRDGVPGAHRVRRLAKASR